MRLAVMFLHTGTEAVRCWLGLWRRREHCTEYRGGREADTEPGM